MHAFTSSIYKVTRIHSHFHPVSIYKVTHTHLLMLFLIHTLTHTLGMLSSQWVLTIVLTLSSNDLDLCPGIFFSPLCSPTSCRSIRGSHQSSPTLLCGGIWGVRPHYNCVPNRCHLPSIAALPG